MGNSKDYIVMFYDKKGEGRMLGVAEKFDPRNSCVIRDSVPSRYKCPSWYAKEFVEDGKWKG